MHGDIADQVRVDVQRSAVNLYLPDVGAMEHDRLSPNDAQCLVFAGPRIVASELAVDVDALSSELHFEIVDLDRPIGVCGLARPSCGVVMCGSARSL